MSGPSRSGCSTRCCDEDRCGEFTKGMGKTPRCEAKHNELSHRSNRGVVRGLADSMRSKMHGVRMC